jgi:hypothetical protein
VAALVPAWLVGEWLRVWEGTPWVADAGAVISSGLTLAALAYLAAVRPDADAAWRRALARLGALCILPAVGLAGIAGRGQGAALVPPLHGPWALGWGLALGLPVALALWLRGGQGAWLALAVPWVLALRAAHLAAAPGALPYLLDALGAVALVVWGVRERRSLTVNLGVAAFALTVAAFYFSNVFDRIGRAAGLAGLGLTFLVGGWLLERLRRGLLARIGSGTR